MILRSPCRRPREPLAVPLDPVALLELPHAVRASRLREGRTRPGAPRLRRHARRHHPRRRGRSSRSTPTPSPARARSSSRVRAAGLNGADMLQRKGGYPAPPGSPPDIPGLELAGEVAALGPGATRFAEGDRVMAIVGGGGQAELARRPRAPADAGPGRARLARRPAASPRSSPPPTTRSSPRPACGPASACSSTARAGGVGTAAVQLGAAAGARVTATVRNAELRDARRRARRPRGARPRGLRASTGPSTSSSSSSARRTCPATSRRWRPAAGSSSSASAAGFKAELNLLALMGKRATHHGLDAARAPARGEGADGARDGAPRAAAASRAARCASRSPRRSRSTRSRDAYERFAAGGKLGKVVLLP